MDKKKKKVLLKDNKNWVGIWMFCSHFNYTSCFVSGQIKIFVINSLNHIFMMFSYFIRPNIIIILNLIIPCRVTFLFLFIFFFLSFLSSLLFLLSSFAKFSISILFLPLLKFTSNILLWNQIVISFSFFTLFFYYNLSVDQIIVVD